MNQNTRRHEEKNEPRGQESLSKRFLSRDYVVEMFHMEEKRLGRSLTHTERAETLKEWINRKREIKREIIEQRIRETEEKVRNGIHDLLIKYNFLEDEDGFELLEEIVYESGKSGLEYCHLSVSMFHKEIIFTFDEISDTQKFLEFVANKFIHISYVIRKSSEKQIFFPKEIKESDNDIRSNFPVVISVANKTNFTTKYGKIFSGIDKIVSISSFELQKIENGFNYKLLPKVARVVVSQTPIDPEGFSLGEKIKPCFMKNIEAKRKCIEKDIREKLLFEANCSCQQCGAMESNGATLEVDHIVPISKGGTDDYQNLQILCATCNRKKSDSI